jgi:hypothetical protein
METILQTLLMVLGCLALLLVFATLCVAAYLGSKTGDYEARKIGLRRPDHLRQKSEKDNGPARSNL